MNARWMRPGTRHIVVMLLLLASLSSTAQPRSELAPPPGFDPAEGQKRARALLSHLLAQRPDQDLTNSGMLKITDRADQTRSVPIRFEIHSGSTQWRNVYQAGSADAVAGERLVVVHEENAPDEYLLSSGPGERPRKISGNQLMVPFAGSDFWLVDLGLAFLHWPQQRVIRTQMRKSQNCDVLESTNPNPAPGAYSRVLSWIAINRPEEIVIVHAEAYDQRNKVLKEFDPKKLQKVNGAWQLEEMEIRNRQTRSHTRIEFELGE